ncbi:hypothetical protein CAL7716_100090 (plasmid) [Calothrix sp. PCC 7716]|nr:hypothetical protein CAL7716_100090 [Calothrix sp. PCC 7716]
MVYVIYNPVTSIYSWHNNDGSRYIPFSNESPEYYLIGGNSTRYYSQSALKRFKLTAKEIATMTPDYVLPNPRYPGKGNMKLYSTLAINKVCPF